MWDRDKPSRTRTRTQNLGLRTRTRTRTQNSGLRTRTRTRTQHSMAENKNPFFKNKGKDLVQSSKTRTKTDSARTSKMTQL